MSTKTSKKAMFDTVLQAVVTLTEKGGRGVLIAGEYVLTAAHCLSFDFSLGYWAVADHLEPATAADGRELLLAIHAADVVNDVAVLGTPDPQRLFTESDAFQEFVENTKPAQLADGPLGEGEIAGHVLNANGKWVAGEGEVVCPNQTRITLCTTRQIDGGASGGPIVNEVGHLLALVSDSTNNAGAGNHECTGFRPLECLPVWLCKQIRASLTKKHEPKPEGEDEPEVMINIPPPPGVVVPTVAAAKKGKQKR